MQAKERRPAALPERVDNFWSHHTVESKLFKSAEESERYIQWRFSQYPMHREFMDLYGSHDGEVIVDYGCGPGNDVVGFLLYTNATKVIGIDVSDKALALARARIKLHDLDPARYELIKSTNSDDTVHVPDGAADFVHCSGVLHHVADPKATLRELNRMLRPGGRAAIMVYNRNSLWFHLYTAYERMIVQGLFQGMSVTEAFSKNTDGPDCPVSRCWTPLEFVRMCARAGFDAHFVGGNLSLVELDALKNHRDAALVDPHLARPHKSFIRELGTGALGYPTYRGFLAGIGGVYRLQKLA